MNSSHILKPTAICPETWRPILWREWQKSRKSLILIALLCAAFFLIVPIDLNGVGLLVATLIIGQYLAVTLGGGDISEGAERYAFILPLRRADYFWARYVAGLAIVVVFTGLAYVMNAGDLHRYFWGIFCESGLSDARVNSYPDGSIGLYIFCGVLGFSNSYCFATGARRPGTLAGSWFVGLFVTYALPALLLSIIAVLNEVRVEPQLKSTLFVLLSAVISAIVLSYLSRAYVGKNTETDVEKSHDGRGWVTAVFLFIVAYALIAFLASY